MYCGGIAWTVIDVAGTFGGSMDTAVQEREPYYLRPKQPALSAVEKENSRHQQ